MKFKQILKHVTIISAVSMAAMTANVHAAGYLKIGDIKGESLRASSQEQQTTQVRRVGDSTPQPASMTPEQTEKLRKAIKEALKPPCKLNSNTPCPPPCGINSNC